MILHYLMIKTMVIAKLSRPCPSDKDTSLVLYCSPLCISEVIEGLTPSNLLDLQIEFIKVIEKDINLCSHD